MLESTKLILNRMESNPEEFFYREAKWAHIVNYHESCLPKEDLDALKEGFNKCRQQEFMGEVMKAIVHEHNLSRGRQYEIGGMPIKPDFIDYSHAVETKTELVPVSREGQMVNYDSATDSFAYTTGGWR